MFITINPSLTLARRDDDGADEPRAIEFEVGAEVLTAAERVFGTPSEGPVWRIISPSGRVDLRRASSRVGALVVDRLAALPWLYKVLFQTPVGFVERAVHTAGRRAVVAAYDDYLALRCAAARESGNPARAAALARLEDEVHDLLRLPPSELVQNLQLRVRAHPHGRAQALATSPHMTPELFDDHGAILAAIALHPDNKDERSSANLLPQTGLVVLNLMHLPEDERDRLDAEARRPGELELDATGHVYGYFVHAGEPVLEASVVRAFPVMTALMARTRAQGCSWVSFEARGPIVDSLPRF